MSNSYMWEQSPQISHHGIRSQDKFPLLSLTRAKRRRAKSRRKKHITSPMSSSQSHSTRSLKSTIASNESSPKKYRNTMHNFVPQTNNSPKKPLTRISELHGFLTDMNVSELLAKTNYNRRELYVMYVRFKALCAMSPTPDGIDRKTFKQGVARLSVEDDLFVNRVYDLIDEDQSDSIEWDEFLTVMSALEKGNKTNRKSQISFFFKVYDLDGDGVISRNDLATMFLSSSMLKQDQTTQDLVDAFVRRVFKVVTGNENKNILTEQDVTKYLNGEGANEDVWDLFGRSMLKDFTTRRNV
eukprot:1088389_1